MTKKLGKNAQSSDLKRNKLENYAGNVTVI